MILCSEVRNAVHLILGRDGPIFVTSKLAHRAFIVTDMYVYILFYFNFYFYFILICFFLFVN